jgi:hypothetical protein
MSTNGSPSPNGSLKGTLFNGSMLNVWAESGEKFMRNWSSYVADSLQRTILTWDTLRERGNEAIEHRNEGFPPLLKFQYEVLIEGRELLRPVNYQLLRIVPPEGVVTNPNARPYVVIDPRAGHGPGIGGFKEDSEIGVALRAGHPVYFVTFLPEPVEGQTLADIVAAEAHFVETVRARHPLSEKPAIIGNCQAGWAVAMLASAAPHVCGPVILAGAPLSYWGGKRGENPMRYNGGMVGGSWTALMLADLGNGKFDGAYLVDNFERLNPANTYWEKIYNLYSKVDTESKRFLEFERWWSGFFLMNREEFRTIVEQLFIGNKLSRNELTSKDGSVRVDLRNITEPIVVFCSWGDNITPPAQALGWILDLYSSLDEIKANRQTIVYNVHQNIGHLGIFVSGSIAKKEHAEIIANTDLIELLPPGLYEMRIARRDPNSPDFAESPYEVTFEDRNLGDIHELCGNRADDQYFEVVERISERNAALYELLLAPVVRGFSSESTAQLFRQMYPARLRRLIWSDKINPFTAPLAALAQQVRDNRVAPLDPENSFLQAQTRFSDVMVDAWNRFRDARDKATEQLFFSLYGQPALRAAVGLPPVDPLDTDGARAPGMSHARKELIRLRMQQIKANASTGTKLDAFARALLYIRGHEGVVREEGYRAMLEVARDMLGDGMPSNSQFREALRNQYFMLHLDRDLAIETLPALLPEPDDRKQMIEGFRRVAERRHVTHHMRERVDRLERLFGLVPA